MPKGSGMVVDGSVIAEYQMMPSAVLIADAETTVGAIVRFPGQHGVVKLPDVHAVDGNAPVVNDTASSVMVSTPEVRATWRIR